MIITRGSSMTIPNGVVLRKSIEPPPTTQARQSKRFMNPVSAIAFSSGVEARAASFTASFVINPAMPTPKYHSAKIRRPAMDKYFLSTNIRLLVSGLSLTY